MAGVGHPLIQMEDITKVFQDGEGGVKALAGIDLEIHAGEYVSIVGPSGCGKSTMLAIMAGCSIRRPRASTTSTASWSGI